VPPVRDVPLPDLPGVDHRFVDVGGLTIHVAEAGPPDGDLVVLLHGWPQHWWSWRLVIPLLEDRYRLIVPDLRGMGWTAAPPGGYEKEQLVTDLFGLLDELGVEQVALAGHDWGGWVGFLAALREPERVRALLALGIIHPFQRPSLGRALQAWRGAYQVLLATPFVSTSMLRASSRVVTTAIRAGSVDRAAFSRRDLELYGQVLRDPARAQASSQLYRTFLLREVPQLDRYRERRLTVPTRLVVGARDPIASRSLLRGWEDHADDMSVEVLPGVGHFLPEEAPVAVAAAAQALFGSRS